MFNKKYKERINELERVLKEKEKELMLLKKEYYAVKEETAQQIMDIEKELIEKNKKINVLKRNNTAKEKRINDLKEKIEILKETQCCGTEKCSCHSKDKKSKSKK